MNIPVTITNLSTDRLKSIMESGMASHFNDLDARVSYHSNVATHISMWEDGWFIYYFDVSISVELL